ncbi:hypothetical protein [Rhodospirillum centenum]|uniref:Uncharacterized protein n=1 Tax=Rhodospirillum centenum (strain ATCC 51521 / SW) TaxID=414684 RepID=B6IX01_RHOCS|nr:hypothetical protein [Rhodospirillum centenum]ACJ00825.1 hypothetical protein RC1_3467 [Rhodospirillum centenum SW]
MRVPFPRRPAMPAFRPAALAMMLWLTAMPAAATDGPAARDGSRQEQARQGVWHATCDGRGAARICSVTARHAYADHRGGRGRVSITLRRDSACTSLHVGFDRDIDVRRPVLLQVDDGPVHGFHTDRELGALARAVDEGPSAPRTPMAPAFTAFLEEVATGRLAPGTDAASELVARFALLKETRRLGVACPGTDRLLPELHRGRMLHLSFHVRREEEPAPYHWTVFDRRTLSVPLAGLDILLDSPAPLP